MSINQFKKGGARFANREIASISNSPINAIYPSYGGSSKLPIQDELLLARAGSGWRKYDIYLDLLVDAHAFAMWDKQMATITSKEILIEPASESKLDLEVARYCKTLIKRLGFNDESGYDNLAIANNDFSFNQLEMAMHIAEIIGYSFAEIIWQRDSQGKIWPGQIKAKDPRRFEFYLGDNNLIYPKLLTRRHATSGIYLPDRKFMLFQHWALPTESPYGFGLGRFLYFPIQWKREALTYWLRIVDRHHEPSRIGSYPANATQEQIEGFFNLVRGLTNDSAAVLPEGFTIEFVEHNAQNAEALLNSLLEYCDRQISLLLLGETSTGEALTGNVASETINNNIRLTKAKAWSDAFLQVFSQTVLRWSIEANYPGAAIPLLSRNWDAKHTVDQIIDQVSKLKNAGYKVSADWVEKMTNIPIVKPKKLKPIPGSKSSNN